MTIKTAVGGTRSIGRDQEAVIDEVRLLWHALVRRGEALHEQEGLSMGMRAILEFLLRNGPTTVPNMARSRGVSRQHVQSLVNPLLEQGLVHPDENPAHRRSPLMRLSRSGERSIARMRRREATAFFGKSPGLSHAELSRTADTLRRIRTAIGD